MVLPLKVLRKKTMMVFRLFFREIFSQRLAFRKKVSTTFFSEVLEIDLVERTAVSISRVVLGGVLGLKIMKPTATEKQAKQI